ncbi:MAG TPA: hypothetical protein VKG23_10315 [Thermoanaerobaculia bacterium]|nr:hypothetical protein [Thermoanaerobaculia bacterium]
MRGRRGEGRGPGPGARRLHHADDAVDGGHAPDRRGSEAPLPKIHVPAKDDICYATQNRQVAVRALAKRAQLILVVGSRNSSNSNRLVEEAVLAGARAYLVDDVSEIDPSWLDGVETVGITSGASAPEFLVNEIVRVLKSGGAREVEEVLTVEEDVHFPLPPEVSGARRASEAPSTLPVRS